MSIIAFIGTGTMGAPMAANLARAGFDLRLWNRTRSKAEAVAAAVGCRVADTPAAAAEEADIIVTMLADLEPLREVYAGSDGVVETIKDGAVCVDMGTTGPSGVAELAEIVAAAGGVLVDAPVSGSRAAAESAELTIMVGGSAAAVATVRPALESMGSTVYHLGPPGAGSVVKLAVNTVIHALGNAVSESLVMAERAGVERAAVYEVFEHSAVAAPMLTYRRDAFLSPQDTSPMFAMTLAEKDLRLIVALAEDVGVPARQARANLDIVSGAVAAGYGDHDMADVAVHLREHTDSRSGHDGSRRQDAP